MRAWPGHDNQYLINPYGLLFHEITPSRLIKVNFDGELISGDFPYNDAGHAIHSAVLKARPDINVALHSHTRAGMAVACMEEGLLPMSQQARRKSSICCVITNTDLLTRTIPRNAAGSVKTSPISG